MDSTIQIYNVCPSKFKFELAGHSRRITGLAFSTKLNVLVSSAADDEIVVWEYSDDGKSTEKKKSCFLQFPCRGRASASDLLDTKVQFQQDQKHFVAVNELTLAMYETTELECKEQWCAVGLSQMIVHATFSCAGVCCL